MGNTLNDLINKSPMLYNAAKVQYQIDIHNHVLAIRICDWVFIALALTLITAIVVHIITRGYSFVPFTIYVIVAGALVMTLIVWSVNAYGLWWMHHNPTLALWQEILPSNS